MTRGGRQQYGVGRYTASESDLIMGGYRTFGAEPPARGIIYCHGAGETVETMSATNSGTVPMRAVLSRISLNATVALIQAGGDWFGNAAQIAKVQLAVDWLRSTWGVTGKIGFVATSMGSSTAHNYAHANPDEVAFIAGFLPLVDLTTLHANPTYTATLDALYPPNWSEATYGADYNPVTYAEDGLPTDLPIKLWYATNDVVVAPSTITAFHEARPWTEIQTTFAGGHTYTSLDTTTADDIVAWVNAH